MIVERAAYHLDADAIRHKLRHAPAWVRSSKPARRSPPATTAILRPAANAPGVAGWLVGSVAPGVSDPAYSPQDRLTLPETFAESAWAGVMEQVRHGVKPVMLWTRHAGKMLAATSMGTLRLEHHPLLGIMFEATIEAGPMERMLLAEIGPAGIGVSVAYYAPTLAYEQRDGRKVRVVTSCKVEHIALVRKGSGERALYAAARCFAVTADKRNHLPQAWSDARTSAWKLMRKAGKATG